MFLNSKVHHFRVKCWILLKPVLGGVDGNLHFAVPSMNRLNQTEPATFSIVLCWTFFRDSVFLYFRFDRSFWTPLIVTCIGFGVGKWLGRWAMSSLVKTEVKNWSFRSSAFCLLSLYANPSLWVKTHQRCLSSWIWYSSRRLLGFDGLAGACLICGHRQRIYLYIADTWEV
jgi:hypothetical protein